jgi:hypothetical protein
MNFHGFTVFGEEFGGLTDDKIPERYHEYIPGNQEKTKDEYPYSYDPFLIYYNENAEQMATNFPYTDRLKQWDWDKYQRLCLKHFGNKSDHWHDRPADKIEAFLCDYTDKKVVLIANIQYCNVANGYPVWCLHFYTIPEKEKTDAMGKDNTKSGD